jgi:hypothetical protein
MAERVVPMEDIRNEYIMLSKTWMRKEHEKMHLGKRVWGRGWLSRNKIVWQLNAKIRHDFDQQVENLSTV